MRNIGECICKEREIAAAQEVLRAYGRSGTPMHAGLLTHDTMSQSRTPLFPARADLRGIYHA
eukprot:5777817-Pleurochrysis_carterae.AAC.1